MSPLQVSPQATPRLVLTTASIPPSMTMAPLMAAPQLILLIQV